MRNDKIDQIWNEARESMNEPNDETEELSKPSLDEQIEELERDYDRFNRADESRINTTTSAWADMADDVREDLIDLKIQKVEKLGKKHDAMDHDDFIGAGRKKKRLYSRYSTLKGEVEELQAARSQ